MSALEHISLAMFACPWFIEVPLVVPDAIPTPTPSLVTTPVSLEECAVMRATLNSLELAVG